MTRYLALAALALLLALSCRPEPTPGHAMAMAQSRWCLAELDRAERVLDTHARWTTWLAGYQTVPAKARRHR